MSNENHYDPTEDAVSVGVVTSGPMKNGIVISLNGITHFVRREEAHYVRLALGTALDASATCREVQDEIEGLKSRGY